MYTKPIQRSCHPEIKCHFLGGAWKFFGRFIFFLGGGGGGVFVFVMLTISSHLIGSKPLKGVQRLRKVIWSFLVKAGHRMLLPPRSYQHLCRRHVFGMATAYTASSAWETRLELITTISTLAICKLLCLKAFFWSIADRGNALFCVERKQATGFSCLPCHG